MLTNCMVLTEGFDSQPVGCIVILRPMRHKGTFIQAVGRGLRKVDPERFPGIVKTDCIVLDFAGAAAAHGSIEQDVRLTEEDARGAAASPTRSARTARRSCRSASPAARSAATSGSAAIREKRLLEAFDLTEIDLLNRSPFRWCDLFGDDHALIASPASTPGAACSSTASTGTRWASRGRGTAAPPGGRHPAQVLAAADDYLREIETTAAASKSRRWLKDPATAKQIELLQRAGYPVSAFDFGLSKYAANCHLNFLWNQTAITRRCSPPSRRGGRPDDGLPFRRPRRLRRWHPRGGSARCADGRRVASAGSTRYGRSRRGRRTGSARSPARGSGRAAQGGRPPWLTSPIWKGGDPRRDEAGRRDHGRDRLVTRLCDLSEAQVLTLIEVAVGGFQDAMRLAAQVRRPEVPF